MIVDLILYAMVAIVLGFLIYRYARYSPWRSTDAGRAFMLMKCSLMTLVLYALVVIAVGPGDWQNVARPAVTLSILAALTYQSVVMVHRQGGMDRKRKPEPDIEQHDPMT